MSSPEKRRVSRRHFLQTTGTLAATAWTASSYARIIGANDRIRIGFIGVGGMGSGHVDAVVGLKQKDNLEAVAVADCWKTRRGGRRRRGPELRSPSPTTAACSISRRSTTSRSPRPNIGTPG